LSKFLIKEVDRQIVSIKTFRVNIFHKNQYYYTIDQILNREGCYYGEAINQL